jgi:hypothetical protein
MMPPKATVIPIRASGIFREPTLVEILSDPITKAVMRADAVDAAKLDAMLRDVAHTLSDIDRSRLVASERRSAADRWPLARSS